MKRPYRVFCYIQPGLPRQGGLATQVPAAFGSSDTACKVAIERLTTAWPRGDITRVAVHRIHDSRDPGHPEHPIWFHLDDNGEVVRTQKGADEPFDIWGYSS